MSIRMGFTLACVSLVLALFNELGTFVAAQGQDTCSEHPVAPTDAIVVCKAEENVVTENFAVDTVCTAVCQVGKTPDTNPQHNTATCTAAGETPTWDPDTFEMTCAECATECPQGDECCEKFECVASGGARDATSTCKGCDAPTFSNGDATCKFGELPVASDGGLFPIDTQCTCNNDPAKVITCGNGGPNAPVFDALTLDCSEEPPPPETCDAEPDKPDGSILVCTFEGTVVTDQFAVGTECTATCEVGKQPADESAAKTAICTPSDEEGGGTPAFVPAIAMTCDPCPTKCTQDANCCDNFECVAPEAREGESTCKGCDPPGLDNAATCKSGDLPVDPAGLIPIGTVCTCNDIAKSITCGDGGPEGAPAFDENTLDCANCPDPDRAENASLKCTRGSEGEEAVSPYLVGDVCTATCNVGFSAQPNEVAATCKADSTAPTNAAWNVTAALSCVDCLAGACTSNKQCCEGSFQCVTSKERAAGECKGCDTPTITGEGAGEATCTTADDRDVEATGELFPLGTTCQCVNGDAPAITCNEGGQLTEAPTFSGELTCGEPAPQGCKAPEVTGGTLECKNQGGQAANPDENGFYPSNTTCTLACNDGFHAEGNEMTTTCPAGSTGGTFAPALAKCVPNAAAEGCAPVTVEHGTLAYTKGGNTQDVDGNGKYPTGTNCDLTCDGGYRAKGGVIQASCQDDGSGNFNPALACDPCGGEKCPKAAGCCTDYECVDTKCTGCELTPVNHATAACTYSGSNIAYETQKPQFPVNTQCTFTCMKAPSTGPDTADTTCTTGNGGAPKFDGVTLACPDAPPPECKKPNADVICNFPNGTVTDSDTYTGDYPQGTICTFKCKEKDMYPEKETGVATCTTDSLNNAQFRPEIQSTTCVPTCAPEAVANADVKFEPDEKTSANTYYVGTKCTATCKSGYTSSGTGEATCTMNATDPQDADFAPVIDLVCKAWGSISAIPDPLTIGVFILLSLISAALL